MVSKKFGTTRRLKSGNWQARYKYRLNEYKAPRTFPTKSRAQGWLDEEEKLILLDEWTPPDQRARAAEARQLNAARTVGNWLDDFHESLKHGAQAVRRSTMQDYLKVTANRITNPLPPGDLEPDITRLKDIPLVELKRADVYRWWDAVQRTYTTPTTNQKAYKRLKAACAEAARRELIETSPVDVPAAARKVKPEEKYLPTDAELQAVLGAMPPRYKLVTALTLFHGLRIGEALALEQRDVILENPADPVPLAPRWGLEVRQTAARITDPGKPTFQYVQPTKTAAGRRRVPIMVEFLPVLHEHLAKHAPDAPTLLQAWDGERQAWLLTVTNNGAMMMDTSYRSVLDRAEDRAEVTREVRPHSGRRWLITRLAEQGAHVKEIGQIVGDDDMDTIMQVYMKVRAERPTEMMGRVGLTLEIEGADNGEEEERADDSAGHGDADNERQ